MRKDEHQMSNLDQYKKDLASLIATGEHLQLSIKAECYPEQFESSVKKKFGAKAKEIIADLPPLELRGPLVECFAG